MSEQCIKDWIQSFSDPVQKRIYGLAYGRMNYVKGFIKQDCTVEEAIKWVRENRGYEIEATVTALESEHEPI